MVCFVTIRQRDLHESPAGVTRPVEQAPAQQEELDREPVTGLPAPPSVAAPAAPALGVVGTVTRTGRTAGRCRSSP